MGNTGAALQKGAQQRLAVRERLIGIVRIDSDQPHFYSERDAQLALAFANQAAAAIENARLYDQARDLATLEERQRLARELHDAVTQTLFSASLIAEALPDSESQSITAPSIRTSP